MRADVGRPRGVESPPLLVGWVLDLSGGMSQLGWGLSFLSVAMLMALPLVTFWVIRPRELEGDQRKTT